MKRRAMAPAPWEVDVESSVRDRLYGARLEVTATPIGAGKPAALGGRYRLLERLGMGGSAGVYRARDERLRREVAVKAIVEWHADDPASVRRFQREAELSARLRHPNIPAVLDAGNRPRNYIVMDLIDGRDAAALLEQEEPLATEQAIDLVVQVSEALEHAHARGVLHCDVAPRNVLIAHTGGSASLVDFGAAVDAFGAGHQEQVMGTPGYVAPEIIRGARPSPRSDLYSLGVLAYRLLGGPPPFSGRATWPTAVSNLPSLAEVRPDLPGSVAVVVDDAMAARPAARPASLAAFRDALLQTHAARLRAA